MVRRWLILTFFSLLTLLSKAQEEPNSNYKKKKLSIEEINFIGSYYAQDGNNSAVTGGDGTEELTDLTSFYNITLNLPSTEKYKKNIDFNVGIDYYTSASSDKIDPNSITSPSYSDIRIYPSLGYRFTNNIKKYTTGVNVSFSNEYDYISLGLGAQFSKTSKDNSRDINIKGGVFFDRWSVILPVELRPEGYGSGSETDSRPIDEKPRNTYNMSIALSQIINKRTQVSFIFEPSYQSGLLSTPYQRVYFQDDIVSVENLPEDRYRFSTGMRVNYFLNTFMVLRNFLRYYYDSWGMRSATIQIESPIKLHPQVSLSPLYRFNVQSAIDYFKEKNEHTQMDKFYTSDFDLSALQTHFFNIELHYGNLEGMFFIPSLKETDLRLGYYLRNDGLSAYIISLAFKLK